MDQTQVVIDGNKILMVCQELVIVLFCILYAYPIVPSRIVDDRASSSWYLVGSTANLRDAITKLMQSSEVLRASLAPGFGLEKLTYTAVCDLRTLNEMLDLRLGEEGLPVACRQMMSALQAVYRRVTSESDNLTTREGMQVLFQRLQLLGPTFKLPADRADRSGLLRFCNEQTVEWLQPYFATDPLFFNPLGMTAACSV